MKKLLGLLGAISLTSTSFASVGCSYAQSEKAAVIRKILSIQLGAISGLRPLLANETSGYDFDVLKTVADNQKIKEQLPQLTGVGVNSNFKDYSLSLFGDLNYFNSGKIKEVNNFSEQNLAGENQVNEKNKFSFKSDVKPYGEGVKTTLNTVSLILSIVKTNNGFDERMSGILSSAMGSVGGFLNNDTINSIDGALGTIKSLKSLTPILGSLIPALSKTGIIEQIFSGLAEGKDIITLILGLIPEIVTTLVPDLNATLKNLVKDAPNPEKITFREMMWSSQARLGNLISKATGGENIFNTKEELYPKLSSWNETSPISAKLEPTLTKILKGESSFDFGKLINNVDDLVYILVSALSYLSISKLDEINDSYKTPKDVNHLFSDSLENSEYLLKNRDQKISSTNLDINKSLKILFDSLIINNNDTGVKIQRLLTFLIGSGDKSAKMNALLPKANNADGLFSLLVQGLGYSLPKVVSDLQQFTALLPKILTNVVNNLIQNLDMSAVIGLIGKIVEGISEFQEEFKTPFDSIFNTDIIGRLLTKLAPDLGNTINGILGDKPFNLKNLLTTELNKISSSIPISLSISEIAQSIVNEMENKKYIVTGKSIKSTESQSITDGLNSIIDALTIKKYDIYVDGTPEAIIKDASLIKAIADLSSNAGHYYKEVGVTTNESSPLPHGPDAAGKLIGLELDENGKFEKGSLLEGIKKVFEAESVRKISNDILDVASKISEKNKKDVDGPFTEMIDFKNFEYKKAKIKEEYIQIDENNKRLVEIIYFDFSYINPITKRKVSAYVEILDNLNNNHLQLYKLIKR